MWYHQSKKPVAILLPIDHCSIHHPKSRNPLLHLKIFVQPQTIWKGCISLTIHVLQGRNATISSCCVHNGLIECIDYSKTTWTRLCSLWHLDLTMNWQISHWSENIYSLHVCVYNHMKIGSQNSKTRKQMEMFTSHWILDLSHELIFLIYTSQFHPCHLFPPHEISAQHKDLDLCGENKDHITKNNK